MEAGPSASIKSLVPYHRRQRERIHHLATKFDAGCFQNGPMAFLSKNIASISQSSAPKLLKANYATVARHEWPSGRHHPPTPYQIMNLEPSAPYVREKFSELVKIYHPDRCDHPANQICAQLSPEVRLERYRLIVAAHNILSDPAKRKAYDRFGVGWTGASATSGSSHPSFTSSPYVRSEDPIHQNGTWEDWERWRWDQYQKEQAGYKTEPRFTSHRRFAGGIMAFTLFAAMLQNGYISNVTETRRNVIHERSYEAELYMKKKKEETKARNKAGRIQDFVEQRDSLLSNQGLADMVLNPDTCADVGAQRTDIDADLRRKYR